MINTSYRAKQSSKQLIKYYSKKPRLHVGIDEEYFYITDGYQVSRVNIKILPAELKKFAMQLIMKELDQNVLYDITEGGITSKEIHHLIKIYADSKNYESIVYTGLKMTTNKEDAYIFQGKSEYIFISCEKLDGFGLRIIDLKLTGNKHLDPVFFEDSGFEHLILPIRCLSSLEFLKKI